MRHLIRKWPGILLILILAAAMIPIKPVDVHAEPEPLVFEDSDTLDIPENTVGVPITAFSVAGQVSGGEAPYTFTKDSFGPGWIEVSEDGTISGTPDFEGWNDELLVRVTDVNLESAVIGIKVGNSIENDGKNVIKTIKGTTEDSLADICDVGKDCTKYISIELQSAEPVVDATPDDIYKGIYIESGLGWQKKVDGNWVWFDDAEHPYSVFDAGTWRYAVHVCVEKEAAQKNKLALDAELLINGTPWLLDYVFAGKDEETGQPYYIAVFVSEEFHPGEQEIHSIRVDSITKPVAGMNASLAGITLNTEHVTLESIYWVRQFHSEWIEMSEDEPFQEDGNYALRTVAKADEGYRFAEDVQVLYDGTPAYVLDRFDEEILAHLVMPFATASDALYVVTAGTLNVREGTSTDVNRVGGLKYGDVIQAKAEQNGWVLVETDSMTGWVNRSYLALTYSKETAFEDGPVYYEVAAGEMNVRASFSTESTRIGGVGNGKQVLATGAVVNGKDTWIVMDYYDSILDAHKLGFILFSREKDDGKTTYYFTGTETAPVKGSGEEDEPSDEVHVGTGGVSPHVWLDTGDGTIALYIAKASGTEQNIGLDDDMVQLEEECVLSTVFYSDDAYNFKALTQDKIVLPEDSLFEVKEFSILEGGAAVKLFLAPKEPVKVTFESDGGTAVSSMTIAKGQSVPKPSDPEKEDWTFGGWYTDEALTSAYDFDAAVTEALTLYAKWSSDIAYTFSKGADASWTKGSASGLAYTVNRSRKDEETFARFTGIEIDGTPVDASNYTAESGSLNATLKASYLETLSVGAHTVKVNFDDGSAETTLTIAKGAKVPQTGDCLNPVRWIALTAFSLAGITAVLGFRRKSRI